MATAECVGETAVRTAKIWEVRVRPLRGLSLAFPYLSFYTRLAGTFQDKEGVATHLMCPVGGHREEYTL
jgi:hypothetical protein